MKLSRFLDSESSRKRIQIYWIILVLLWDVAKTIVLDKVFGKFGLNPFYYLAINVACTLPYALSTAKMVFEIYLNRWRRALIFGIFAVIFHFIPDIYILINAEHAPRRIIDSFIVTAIILTIFTVHGVVIQIRARKSGNANNK